MSYGIITKSGGTIMFTSYPVEEYPKKHGTIFTVYLPVMTESETAAAAGAA